MLHNACIAPHTLAKQLLVDTTHVQDYMYSSGCLHLMLLSSARGYIYLICTDREYINTLQWCMAPTCKRCTGYVCYVYGVHVGTFVKIDMCVYMHR